MGIDLCRRDINMAKHQLYGTKVSPSFEEMTGKGMTEEVWGDPFPDSCLSSVGFDDLPELLSAHEPPRPVDKKKGSFPPLEQSLPRLKRRETPFLFVNRKG